MHSLCGPAFCHFVFDRCLRPGFRFWCSGTRSFHCACIFALSALFPQRVWRSIGWKLFKVLSVHKIPYVASVKYTKGSNVKIRAEERPTRRGHTVTTRPRLRGQRLISGSTPSKICPPSLHIEFQSAIPFFFRSVFHVRSVLCFLCFYLLLLPLSGLRAEFSCRRVLFCCFHFFPGFFSPSLPFGPARQFCFWSLGKKLGST